MKYIMAISGILWSVGLFAQKNVPVGVWKTDRDELIIIHDTSYAMAGGIIEMNGWMSHFEVTITNDSVLFDSKNQSYHFLVENQTDSTLILNPISRQSRNAFQRRERIEFRRSTLWNRSKFQFLVYTDSCTAYHGPCSIN